jgi:hypothetical protein
MFVFVLLTKYFLGDQIKKNGIGRACGTYGGDESCIQCLGVETWWKDTTWPLGIPRHRWADNIKMDLQELVSGGLNWMNLAKDRDKWQALNAVMNLQVPYNAGNFWTS